MCRGVCFSMVTHNCPGRKNPWELPWRTKVNSEAMIAAKSGKHFFVQTPPSLSSRVPWKHSWGSHLQASRFASLAIGNQVKRFPMSGEYSNELRNAKPVCFWLSPAILLFTQGGGRKEEVREGGKKKSIGRLGLWCFFAVLSLAEVSDGLNTWPLHPDFRSAPWFSHAVSQLGLPLLKLVFPKI